MASLQELRHTFEVNPNCQLISPDEFTSMMISHAHFVRADEPNANLLGLIDEQTGTRVLVRAEELERVRATTLLWN